MKRTMLAVLLAFLSLSFPFAVIPAQAAQTWTVIAGGESKGSTVWSNAFHPRKLEIATGDTVTWKYQGFHTVSFLGGAAMPELTVHEGNKTYFNPRVFFPVGGKTFDGEGYRNSGAPPEDPAAIAKFRYSLTFTKPGTYTYVCPIHGPGMGGTIVVKDRATSTPAAEAGRGAREQQATVAAGSNALAQWKTERRGGAVVVPLVGNLAEGYSVLRFSRNPLVVARGTTVTWEMRDPFEIHTVTFTSGQKPPEFIVPQPQSQGPPKLLMNPRAAVPTSQKAYNGTGYVNSGILFPAGTPANLPKSYSLTFTRAGRYEYWCITHVLQGMKGVVIVK